MDTPDFMLAGGATGALFTAGDPSMSLMMQRVHLPLEDEEHMPPKEKSQPSEEEIAVLEWWIENGASFEMLVSDPSIPDWVLALIASEDDFSSAETPLSAVLDLGAVQALRDKFVGIQRVEQGSDLLWVDLSAVATSADDTLIAELRALGANVLWINLSRTQISDTSMSVIGSFSKLEKLDLRATAVTDLGLAELKNIANIQNLNLADTAITFASAPTILKLPQGASINLNGTAWTAEDAQALRRFRPDLSVNYIGDL